MATFIWRTQERYVGVIGMHSSGKTVFLTSLIDHLMNHDPARFRLGVDTAEPVTLRKVRPEAVTAGWEAFHYAGNRAALATSGRWPRKTKDRAEFALGFERSDWRFNSALLRLFDMPGERLADAAMFGQTYEQWSDHWHRYTADDAHQRAASAGFLDVLNRPTPDEPALIEAYRLALATAVGRHFKPFVSPSSFLLDAAGGRGPRRDARRHRRRPVRRHVGRDAVRAAAGDSACGPSGVIPAVRLELRALPARDGRAVPRKPGPLPQPRRTGGRGRDAALGRGDGQRRPADGPRPDARHRAGRNGPGVRPAAGLGGDLAAPAALGEQGRVRRAQDRPRPPGPTATACCT